MIKKILKILFLASIFLFSLGQLGRVSFLNQEINVYLYEPILFLSLSVLLFTYRLVPIRQAFKKYKVIVLFILSLLFSYIIAFPRFGLKENLISLLYFIRLVSYLFYFLYLHFFLKHEDSNGRLFSKGIAFFSIIILSISFIQYVLYPDLRNLLYLGWDPHLNRMFGLFFDTSIAGAIYGVSLLYFLKKRNRFMSLLFLVSLILTFSRASYIAIFIALFYFFASQKIVRYAIFIIALFFLIVLVAPKQFGQGVGLTRTFSVLARINDYQEGIRLWQKNPLFGIGYNRLRYMREPSLKQLIPSHAAASLSSSYLMMLVCGGIIGLALFIASVLKLIIIHKKLASLILFLAIVSFFDNVFFHPFVMFLLGSFLASINPSDKLR